MNRQNHRLLLLTVILVFSSSFITFFFGITNRLFADQENIANFSVSPYIDKEVLLPKQTTKINFVVKNPTNYTEYLHVTYENFRASTDIAGKPDYFKTPINEAVSVYPETWFSPVPQITLPPHSHIPFIIPFTIPATVTAGGHYGGIMFSSTSSENQIDTISLKNRIGIPVIITIPGNIIDNMQLKSFSINRQLYNDFSIFSFSKCLWNSNCDIKFATKLQNNGNIHEDPTGVIEIYNLFHTKVKTIDINQKEGLILPSSERIYNDSIPFSTLNDLQFGKYTAKLTLSYSSKNKILTAEDTFYLINWFPIIVMITIILSIIIMILIRKLLKRGKNLRNLKWREVDL